jgi:class 3 adenylate cyclase
MAQGFAHVAVLAGGLEAWRQQGYPVVHMASQPAPAELPASAAPETPGPAAASVVSPAHALLETFLPHLAEAGALTPQELPTKRHMVLLFVDMTRSTSLLYQHSAEEVLALIQLFMAEVTEIAVAHCGDVKDFEGDGALLYFDDVREAVHAAFALRDALLGKRQAYPALPLPRLSLNLGPLVIGIIGSRFRQSIAMVGPALTIAARLLKHAPPGGIIATEALVRSARRVAPELATRFTLAEQDVALEGIEEGPITVYLAEPACPPASATGT